MGRHLSFVVVRLVSTMVAASLLWSCGGQSGNHESNGGPHGGGQSGDGAGEAGIGGSDDEGGNGGNTAAGAGGGTTSGGSGGMVSSGGFWLGGAPTVKGGSGGTSQGGTTTSPGGGQSSIPVEAPKNCYGLNYSEVGATCEFRFSCQNGVRDTYCYESEPGFWSCSCTTDFNNESFIISSESGVDACGATGRACLTPPERETNCAEVESTNDVDGCMVIEACDTELDVGSGVGAWRSSKNVVDCITDNRGVDTFDCQCTLQRRGVGMRVRADSTQGLCESVLDYCKRDETPEFEGPWECVEASIGLSPDSCDVGHVCFQGMQIDEQVQIVTETERYLFCQAPVDGVSVCTCAGIAGGEVTFEAPFSAVDRASCMAASQYCSETAEIEAEGAVTCTAASESATPRSCDTSLACRQPVTIGGVEYTAFGDLGVTCQQPSTGAPWACACASGSTRIMLEVEEATTSWDACAAAVPRCQEEVDPVIVPSEVQNQFSVSRRE